MKVKVRKNIKYPAYIVGVWFALHMLWISIDGLRPAEGKADVAILFGNPVKADGSLTPWLQGRVDKAAELYRAGRVSIIFASGGPGEQGQPEGDAMRNYLIAHHVPPQNIIADNKGSNSYYTAKDFIKLSDSAHFRSALVVTSFYHITRSKYILRKLGFRQVGGVASDRYFWQDGYGMFREFFAFYKYCMFY